MDTGTTPLLPQMPGFVDFSGRPADRLSTGRWPATLYIIVVAVAERFVFDAVSSNLINYLTKPLGEQTVTAVAAVNMWIGVASMLPLLGAFIADSWLGRYCTIFLSSILYILGLGMLTTSAFYQSSLSSSKQTSSSTPPLQMAFFYISLYIIALAQSGIKPCSQAFGADQFDQNDPQEGDSKSSYFSWLVFGLNGGMTVAIVTMSYVQDYIGWGIGFGIPCVVMIFAFVVFLFGTRIYRYYVVEENIPFIRVWRSFVALAKENSRQSNKMMEASSDSVLVEEARGLLRLFPIWSTCIIYGILYTQPRTLLVKQGSTMDRHIFSSFQVPPAALQAFINITVVLAIPIYDKIFMPTLRKLTGSRITTLQRIGTGMIVSLLSMVLAALVEIKRLKIVSEYGLVDQPETPIPMSLWWMVPQYVLFGVSDVFTMIGLMEFFYDQMPDDMRSLGIALFSSITGVGGILSSILVTTIDGITKKEGDSWFSDNLNRAHLDYFYWLLAGVTAFEFILFLYFAKSYVYR
ncbi:hypothetical protein LUZ60_001785 [Juncus effusus]|nr:hypothetical protein LUZ60_001785 [Juncus effusus]